MSLPPELEPLEKLWTNLLEEYLETYIKKNGLSTNTNTNTNTNTITSTENINNNEEKEKEKEKEKKSEYEVIETACRLLKQNSLAVHYKILHQFKENDKEKDLKNKNMEEKENLSVKINKSEIEEEEEDEEYEKKDDEIEELKGKVSEMEENCIKEQQITLNLLKSLQQSRCISHFSKLQNKWDNFAQVYSSSQDFSAIINEMQKEIMEMKNTKNKFENENGNINGNVNMNLERIIKSKEELENKLTELHNNALHLKRICEVRSHHGFNAPSISVLSTDNRQNTDGNMMDIGEMREKPSNHGRFWHDVLL